MKSSVDYCMDILLFENIHTIRHIVYKGVDDVELKSRLENQMTALVEYMKHGYDSHLDEDDRNVQNTRIALMGRELPNVPKRPKVQENGNEQS